LQQQSLYFIEAQRKKHREIATAEAVLLIVRFTKIKRQIKNNYEDDAYRKYLPLIGILKHANN